MFLFFFFVKCRFCRKMLLISDKALNDIFFSFRIFVQRTSYNVRNFSEEILLG